MLVGLYLAAIDGKSAQSNEEIHWLMSLESVT